MEIGGNKRWNSFLEEHGIPQDLPIREKYSTRAAAWYREMLRAEAEGLEPPLPLPRGSGCLSTHEAPNRTLDVLDRVYSTVQCQNVLKRDTVMAAVALQARAEALQRKRHHAEANSMPEWMCQQLTLLLDEMLQLSDGDKTALLLKEMSTGKMEGFGGEKCSLPALPADLPRKLETLEGLLRTHEAR